MEEVKKAYEEEVKLLKDLCDCLEQERQCLMKGTIQGLWPLKERKERICMQVRDQEHIIRGYMESEGLSGEKALNSGILAPLRKVTSKLKLEVVSRSRENMRIVSDTLDFIDGLIEAITANPLQPGAYGKDNQMGSGPRIIYKEA